jgi:hypothetical protein
MFKLGAGVETVQRLWLACVVGAIPVVTVLNLVVALHLEFDRINHRDVKALITNLLSIVASALLQDHHLAARKKANGSKLEEWRSPVQAAAASTPSSILKKAVNQLLPNQATNLAALYLERNVTKEANRHLKTKSV